MQQKRPTRASFWSWLDTVEVSSLPLNTIFLEWKPYTRNWNDKIRKINNFDCLLAIAKGFLTVHIKISRERKQAKKFSSKKSTYGLCSLFQNTKSIEFVGKYLLYFYLCTRTIWLLYLPFNAIHNDLSSTISNRFFFHCKK